MTRDYTKVDSRLGTKEDLKAVVDACHEAGIRVLFDAVLNHVGRGFWAFQDVLEKHQQSPTPDGSISTGTATLPIMTDSPTRPGQASPSS